MAVIGTWSPNKSGGGSQRRASTRLTAARLLGRIFFDRTKSDINDKRQSFLYTLEIYIHIIGHGFTGVEHLLKPPVFAVSLHLKYKFSRAGAAHAASNKTHTRGHISLNQKSFAIKNTHTSPFRVT